MKIIILLFSAAFSILHYQASAQKYQAQDVLNIIIKTDSTWQATHNYRHDAWWDEAVYHTGNMEAYRVTGRKEFLDYSIKWAQHNNWCGATQTNKNLWTYKRPLYNNNNVMFADWQVCFQTYIDLYFIEKDFKKIERCCEVINYQTNLSNLDYWYWCDALYMAMPVMTRLYKIDKNITYLRKLYEYVRYTDFVMFDTTENLYYRDFKYIYPKYKSPNGKKEFWSRGNGWVLAGLARVLSDLPSNFEHYDFFRKKFVDMANSVIKYQQREGYWTQNIADPDEVPGFETSGTALFTYALAWGVNNKILNKRTFKPIIQKAWKYLAGTALQPDYTVGYIQWIGESAMPNKPVTPQNVTNYGTGAFLLAACEYYRMLAN